MKKKSRKKDENWISRNSEVQLIKNFEVEEVTAQDIEEIMKTFEREIAKRNNEELMKIEKKIYCRWNNEKQESMKNFAVDISSPSRLSCLTQFFSSLAITMRVESRLSAGLAKHIQLSTEAITFIITQMAIVNIPL